MATSFLKFERFETTVPKAKELRPVVERLITLGKNDTLAARRQAYAYLTDKAVVHKLFAEVGPRCKERSGGYTRIIRTRVRNGDAAEMAVIELVDRAGEKTVAPKNKEASGEARPAGKKAAAKKTEVNKQRAKKAPATKETASKAKGE
jgi:large subunit ribosomal protein L17